MNGQSFQNGAGFCQRCGTPMIFDQRTGVPFCPNCGASYPMNLVEQKFYLQKKSGCGTTLIWVLGWLIIFPVPLTILMLRNQKPGKNVRYGIIAVGWIVYLLFAVFLKDKNDETPKNVDNTSSSITVESDDNSISSVISYVDEESDTNSSSTSENKKELKTGFDEATNFKVKNGGLIYSLPDYYKETPSDTEGYEIFKHEEKDGSFAQVGFQLYHDDMFKDGFSENDANSVLKTWMNNFDFGDEVDFLPMTQDPVLGRNEYESGFERKTGNEYIWGYIAMIENEKANGVNLFISYIYRKGSDATADYDYLADMDSIFYSIAIDEDYIYGTTDGSEVSPSDIKESVENGDYSLVTPEFKETMDAYEAFYDEYIEFMNKYKSGEVDVIGMLNDYSEMLTKLDEWTKRMDAIDESTLTPADSAYYLLVTLRVEKKLLEII